MDRLISVKFNNIFLAIVIIAGLIALLNPSFVIGTTQAQYPYDGMDIYPKNNLNIQKIDCINANINLDKLVLSQIPQETTGLTTIAAKETANDESNSAYIHARSDKGLRDKINLDKNFVNICININKNNQQIEDSPIINVMSWNNYLGADISQIFLANTPEEFVTIVGETYNKIQESNYKERANSIAEEIQETQPDLIGLQEMSLLRTQTPSDGPTTPATTISLDYLQILLDALNQRGLIYEPVVVQTAFDGEVPGLISGNLVDIRLTDREVVLARADRDFTLSNIQGGQFDATFSVTTPFGSINIPRAWVSVDVTFDKGDKARFISTHLEPILHPQLSPIIQAQQADELLNGLGNTNLPVILVGDFNSNADGSGTPTYSKLIDAGFIDAWTIKGKGDGFTCCQAADLMNSDFSLDERIDLILFRGDIKVNDIELVGNLQTDRTISGLWPSDHAGVVAKLTKTG